MVALLLFVGVLLGVGLECFCCLFGGCYLGLSFSGWCFGVLLLLWWVTCGVTVWWLVLVVGFG